MIRFLKFGLILCAVMLWGGVKGQNDWHICEHDTIGHGAWEPVERDPDHEIIGVCKNFTQDEMEAFWNRTAHGNTAAMVRYLEINRKYGLNFDRIALILAEDNSVISSNIFRDGDSTFSWTGSGKTYTKWALNFAEFENETWKVREFYEQNRSGKAIKYVLYSDTEIVCEYESVLPIITIAEIKIIEHKYIADDQWWGEQDSVIRNQPTEIVEDCKNFTQEELTAFWEAAGGSITEGERAATTRYLEINKTFGVDFDRIAVYLNNTLLLPNIVRDPTTPTGKGFTWIDCGSTYFKWAISFAEYGDTGWTVIADRSGAKLTYIIFKDDIPIGDTVYSDLPFITIGDPLFIADTTHTICSGEEFIYKPKKVPKGTQYSWAQPTLPDELTGGSSSTDTCHFYSGILYNNGDTAITVTYKVKASTPCGCDTTFEVKVIVNPLPVVTITKPIHDLCIDDDKKMTGNPSGGTWESSNIHVAVIDSVNGKLTLNNSGQTVITYTFTDSDGCTNNDTVMITVLAKPTLTISYNEGETIENNDIITMCQYDSLKLTFTGSPPFILPYTKTVISEGSGTAPVSDTLVVCRKDTTIAMGCINTYIFSIESFTDGSGCEGTSIEPFTITVEQCYNITYNCNDCDDETTMPTDNKKYFAGDTAWIKPPDITMVQKCHDFLGWAFEEGATTPDFEYDGIDFIPKMFVITQDTTLYAVWESKMDTPTFASVRLTYCKGEEILDLPIDSDEGISGTWKPEIDNTSTTTYTFTPTEGQCATATEITIKVNPVYSTPIFVSICNGGEYNFFGTILTDEGTYTYGLQTVEKCDSTIVLSLIVHSAFTAGTINSNGQTVCLNVTANTIGSTIPASGGDDNISYQWKRDGTVVPDANGATYIPLTNTPGTFIYTREAKDNMCNTTWTTSSGSWTITITPLSTASLITSTNDTICSSSNATLTASAPTVTGTPIFRWYADTTTTIVLETGDSFTTPNLTATTTYYVSVEGDNFCEGTADTIGRKAVTVTVNHKPTLNKDTISPLPAICSGNTLTLLDSVSVSSWNGNETDKDQGWYYNATNDTIIDTWTKFTSDSVFVYSQDGYYIKYYAENGCGYSQTNLVTITVNPLPILDSIINYNLCARETQNTIKFGGTNVDAENCIWTNDNTDIGLATSGTGNIPIFTATNGTDSTITATITVTPLSDRDCKGEEKSFTIKVNPTPTTTSICQITPTILMCSDTARGYEYQWGYQINGKDTVIYTRNSCQPIEFSDGINKQYVYFVEKIDTKTGCSIRIPYPEKDSNGQTSNKCGTSPPPSTSPTIKVYPNPTKGHLSVVLTAITGNVAFYLHNMLGQVLLSKQISDYKEGEVMQLDLNYRAGIYLLVVQTNKEVLTSKIVIE